jgi:hypothetical protein
MFEKSKGFLETKGGDRIDAAKETFLVFPGAVKLYKSREAAKEYFKDSLNTAPNMTEVIFEVTLETDAKTRPMDPKLFLADDSEAL